MRLTEWDLFEEVAPPSEVADKVPRFRGPGILSSGVQVVVTFAVVAGSVWSLPTRSQPTGTSTVVEVSRPSTFSASAEQEPRKPRGLYDPDAPHGKSSRRLAQTFDDYFVPAPADEDYGADDYSFF